MADLRTNYKDDILDFSVNEKRKYRVIENDDETISLEDVTIYEQVGDSFGAGDINSINEEVNNKLARKNVGSSSDLGKMPYYTLKNNWESIPVGMVSGLLSYGMGFYVGYKESETNGFFIVQSRSELQDDALRVSGGAYIVSITNGEWTLDKITAENLFFE